MSKWGDKQAEANQLIVNAVSAHLAPGEPLVGAALANQQKMMSAEMYAIGVTPSRLVLVPVDRKWQAKGAPISLTSGDITNSSVWGYGGGAKAWLSMSSDQQIRIETAGQKFKFMMLGGNMLENALAGDGQLRGVDALVEFLLNAKAARG